MYEKYEDDLFKVYMDEVREEPPRKRKKEIMNISDGISELINDLNVEEDVREGLSDAVDALIWNAMALTSLLDEYQFHKFYLIED